MSSVSDWLYTARDYHPLNPNGAIWRGLMEKTGNDPKHIEERAKLRSAQINAIGSGVPVLGGILRGFEGVEKLEDYYKNSGFLPEYQFSDYFGAGGLGSALGYALGNHGDGQYPDNPKYGQRDLEKFHMMYL